MDRILWSRIAYGKSVYDVDTTTDPARLWHDEGRAESVVLDRSVAGARRRRAPWPRAHPLGAGAGRRSSRAAARTERARLCRVPRDDRRPVRRARRRGARRSCRRRFPAATPSRAPVVVVGRTAGRRLRTPGAPRRAGARRARRARPPRGSSARTWRGARARRRSPLRARRPEALRRRTPRRPCAGRAEAAPPPWRDHSGAARTRGCRSHSPSRPRLRRRQTRTTCLRLTSGEALSAGLATSNPKRKGHGYTKEGGFMVQTTNLGGLAGVPELAPVSKRTESRYVLRTDFPAPVARLRSG